MKSNVQKQSKHIISLIHNSFMHIANEKRLPPNMFFPGSAKQFSMTSAAVNWING